MVWYVGRVRPADRDDGALGRVRLHDETGAVLSRAEPAEDFEETRSRTREAFEGLGLPADSANLKRTGPLAGPVRPEDLRHVVVHHLVFSVRLRHPDEADAAEAATAAAVREAFGAEGYRCLWAMHDAGVPGAPGSGHRHVHFHILAKAAHEHGGRRLSFRRADIDGLRACFADYTRLAGLAGEASRREDRAEVRAAVADGEAVLRPHRSRPRAAGRTSLGREVPGWALANEPAMLRRQEAARRRRAAGAPAWPAAPRGPMSDTPAMVERLFGRRRRRRPKSAAEPDGGPVAQAVRRLEGIYLDPAAALASWRAMRGELEAKGRTGALADWWLTHRPEAFGDVTAAAWREGDCVLAADREFRVLLGAAAAAMPAPALVGLSGPEAAARSAAASRAAAAGVAGRRRARQAADVKAIVSSLHGVADVLGAGDGAEAGIGRDVRAAADATARRAEAAARPGRPGPDRADRSREGPERS